MHVYKFVHVKIFLPNWIHNPDVTSLQNKIICVLSWFVNIQVPVDLVIDHSVQVDVARVENALQTNMQFEFDRNKERFAFLKWGSGAFKNMLVVPPGSGIVHQVRYSYHYLINWSFIVQEFIRFYTANNGHWKNLISFAIAWWKNLICTWI